MAHKYLPSSDPDNITQTAIDTFLRGLGNAADPNSILALIGDIVNPEPIYVINQELTPIDNCIFVNPRAIIQGILLVAEAYQKNEVITQENLSTLATKNAETYEAYVNSLSMQSAD